MIFNANFKKNTIWRQAITQAYRMDETDAIHALLSESTLADHQLKQVRETATLLVKGMRQAQHEQGSLLRFLHKYDLSSQEGIVLMCLAEALLRIPDTKTVDRLISDKLSSADWLQHVHRNDSLVLNTATRSLFLAGKIFSSTRDTNRSCTHKIKNLLSAPGIFLTRPFILQGMRILGKHFVMGTCIDKALKRAKPYEAKGYRYSYDMLGEAAKTEADAERYLQSYIHAIHAMGDHAAHPDPIQNPGISIKLSALHPRYEYTNRERILAELTPKVTMLAQLAKSKRIGMTIDAEEADRLDLSLDIIETVLSDDSLMGWEGFGLAVQAYQKRAPYVIDWLADLSKRYHRRFMVRLVKGAYWDAEIKLSQLLGLENYPVFTRKHSTDVSYIACSKKLLEQPDCFFPQFGTQNAYSVAVILELAGSRRDFEFQCLHGMGQSLYDQLVSEKPWHVPCRIYAPVGTHQDLLGYLVRRLLENGANTSFINHIADNTLPIEKLIADPVNRMAHIENKPHPHIPLPMDLFGKSRINSIGIDFSNRETQMTLKHTMDKIEHQQWISGPIINGKLVVHNIAQPVHSPSKTSKIVGYVHEATSDDVEIALRLASQSTWGNTSVDDRAACLERAANAFESHMPKLITLLCQEGGKQIQDGTSEIREAIDFCRYYAMRAREDFTVKTLPGPTGELNQLSLHPRGLMVCISPWNFPMAIFTGQIVAALACGNTVIAKPAEQTPLIAAEIIRLLHAAGIPGDALHLLPGRGEIVGAHLTKDLRTAGVLFTGSTETAKLIQKTLADRAGPIIPLVAETGGQNAMIVDSSALPEQVVSDVLLSAFNSAGQRCSALRVLFLQEDIAPRILKMLKGAMAELTVGDPSLLSTDIGPVIDHDALAALEAHSSAMQQQAELLYQVATDPALEGHFFGPRAFILKNLTPLKREVFGPILHIVPYASNKLDEVLDQLIQTGYGLTLGVHSRIDATIHFIQQKMPVGNLYVNRNMIGAVVGVQPFGGEGLSGTGPKAGGPHYLPRLCIERCISINTTAAGGNASLVSLEES